MIAVGRLKAGPEKVLADDYLRRLQATGRRAGIAAVQVHEFGESQQASVAARMAEEARLVSAVLSPKAFAVVLDERGVLMSSVELANLLRRHLAQGTADLSFVIGGPDGHAPDVREKAGVLLSLGPMTWPHRLVRIMLFEQLYRAVTILTGHPYHRV